MDGERERKDSRQVNNNAPSIRRSSRLGHQNANLSGPFRGGYFDTVDELANLDSSPTRPTSDRRISQASVSYGSDSNVRGRRTSRTQRTSVHRSPSAGILNPMFETKDDLDDLDPNFRKLSVTAAALQSSRRISMRSPGSKLDEAKNGELEEQFFFKAPLSRLTKVLISLTIIFFITTEIMTSIYLLEVYKEPPPKPCDSGSCLVFGQMLRGSLNLSANPCSDFYSYACGNFQRRTPYGDQYRDLDGLVDDELVVRMHQALENLRNTVNVHEDYEKKAWQFYQECLEIDAINVRQSLMQVLQNLSWPLLTFPGSISSPLLELFKEAHIHGADPFFHVSRLPNYDSPGQPYWTIQEGKLSLPLPVYDSPLYRRQYALFIQSLVAKVRGIIHDNLLTELEPASLYAYERIVDVEAELADVKHEPQSFKLTIREFSEAYPAIVKNYDLVEYFTTLTKTDEYLNLVPTRNHAANITKNTVIIMRNRDYFYVLNEILNRMTERDQSIYLGWRVLFHYIDLIGQDPGFWGIVQRFWMSIGYWPRQYQSHGKNCAKTAIDTLPDGGLALYSKEYFNANLTSQINDLLDRLTRTATEIVNSQEWMSDADRKAAAVKFQNLKRQLPYSEELYSKNLTNQLYSKSVVEYDSFFLTIRNFQRVRQHFVLSGIYDTPIEFPDLLSFAFGADYRLDSLNQGLVGVLPRTFVAPFYDASYPSFANYALLGFLYARELAHVVDYEWFMLNKTAGENGGPSNSTLAQYHSSLGSILELYRNTSIQLGLPVNHETLYEDSADQAALRISYRAYQDVIRRTHDSLFPGIGYDQFDFSQMFFLTVAQQFCVNDQSIRLKDVVHIGFSHPKVRLTALMYNSEEFDTAFACGRAANGDWTGQQLLHIPDPPRKIKYRTNITAKQIDEWYHWYERKPGLPTWPKAW